MALNKQQLRAKWKNEKDYYKKQEVGSGTQKFVKEVLKSKLFFNLTEGELSTPETKRKMEFIEEPSKEGKKADIVIFINYENIIPLEVERYKNIEAGVKQILEYQLNWNKNFGILTDGA